MFIAILHIQIVERPFGSIKQWMNQDAFLLRGLAKVRADFTLTALAYNLIVVNLAASRSGIAMARRPRLGAKAVERSRNRVFPLPRSSSRNRTDRKPPNAADYVTTGSFRFPSA
jgi:hypothetical protein